MIVYVRSADRQPALTAFTRSEQMLNLAQPDITLRLDMQGVIQHVDLSSGIPDESLDSWVGRPWVETVADGGADWIRRMIEGARAAGALAFGQVTQRFPSGLELPIEYTAVRLGERVGIVAVGKSLKAVAELQSRLMAAQQALERDFWKLREVETRYRLLFDASNEAVVLLKASNLRIVEANFAAIRALGLAPQRPENLVGKDLLQSLPGREREPLQAMLARVREQGKAPGILIHLGSTLEPWLVRASLMTTDPGPAFLIQFSPAGLRPANPDRVDLPLEDILERIPDGFVVADAGGSIVRANRAFLDLVQAATESSVLGRTLDRWLSRPAADTSLLLDTIRQHGSVRLLSSELEGELGLESKVEISAAGNAPAGPDFVGIVLRDVSRRMTETQHTSSGANGWEDLSASVGSKTLKALVKETVRTLEQRYIQAALDRSGGNRTAAAELLGLSRQSLYMKLNQYGLESGHVPSDEPPG